MTKSIRKFEHTPPEPTSSKFTCPHCHGNTNHDRGDIVYNGDNYVETIRELVATRCRGCDSYIVWSKTTDEGAEDDSSENNTSSDQEVVRIVYPSDAIVPLPSSDMPLNVTKDYKEASTIATSSPRAAIILLRSAVEKMCIHLGQPGKNLDKDIRALVKAQKLNIDQERVLKITQLLGNAGTHGEGTEGELDLNQALAVFSFLNYIVDQLISVPKQIEKMDRDASSLDERRKRNQQARLAQQAAVEDDAAILPQPGAEAGDDNN